MTIERNNYERITKGISITIRPAFMDWHHPWHCFYTFYDGNYERRKEVYDYLGSVKWLMYNEVQSNFKCYFGEEGEFPPCFETYKTNIRPSLRKSHSDFWRSILIDERAMEYSVNLNMCIAWDFSSQNAPQKNSSNSRVRRQFVSGNYDE